MILRLDLRGVEPTLCAMPFALCDIEGGTQMECNEGKNISPREALEPLMTGHVEAQRKLKEARSLIQEVASLAVLRGIEGLEKY